MSYILDALRKSEQQRQQGAMPLLFTTQISSNIKKQPVLLLYGLVAAILICSGILIGWLRPWQQDETESLREPVALTQPEAKPPQISSIPQRLPPEPEKADKPELVLPEKKSLSTTKLASWAGSAKLDKPAPTKVTSQPHKSQTTIALQKAPEQVKDERGRDTAKF